MNENRKYTKEEVLDFLKSNFVMQIATSHENKPSASVVLYTVDDNLNFYFVTHDDSYKSKNLKANSQISLSIWEHNKMLVQADGSTEIISDDKHKESIMSDLTAAAAKDADFLPPMLRIKGGEYVIFKISPNWVRVLDLERKTISQDNSPFTEIKLSS